MSIDSSQAFVLVPKDKWEMLLKQRKQMEQKTPAMTDSADSKDSNHVFPHNKAVPQKRDRSDKQAKCDKTSQWIYY